MPPSADTVERHGNTVPRRLAGGRGVGAGAEPDAMQGDGGVAEVDGGGFGACVGRLAREGDRRCAHDEVLLEQGPSDAALQRERPPGGRQAVERQDERPLAGLEPGVTRVSTTHLQVADGDGKGEAGEGGVVGRGSRVVGHSRVDLHIDGGIAEDRLAHAGAAAVGQAHEIQAGEAHAVERHPHAGTPGAGRVVR